MVSVAVVLEVVEVVVVDDVDVKTKIFFLQFDSSVVEVFLLYLPLIPTEVHRQLKFKV